MIVEHAIETTVYAVVHVVHVVVAGGGHLLHIQGSVGRVQLGIQGSVQGCSGIRGHPTSSDHVHGQVESRGREITTRFGNDADTSTLRKVGLECSINLNRDLLVASVCECKNAIYVCII